MVIENYQGGNMPVNTDVLEFFLLSAGVFAFLAIRFASVGKAPYRNFGFGLTGFSLAFAVWGLIAGLHPSEDSLDLYMTLGVLPFVAGFLFLVSSATFDWLPNNRKLIMTIAIIFLVALFVIRTFWLPSNPGFSDSGFIYFNAQPLVELMYVLTFAGGFMTSLQVVTRSISDRLTAALTRIFFNLVTICGVVMLVSNDDNLQQLNGYLMLAAIVGLFIVYLPKKVSGFLK